MKTLFIFPRSCSILLCSMLLCSIFIFYSQSFAMHKDTIPFDNAYQVIAKYGETINRASKLFNVPSKIIIGVIFKESGGNPSARAEITTAKGLMQTIDSTFDMAHNALKAKGINIIRDPFDPTASILAGSWYLGCMYDQAVIDLKSNPYQREKIESWAAALEYYFAGPKNGIKPQNKITVCSKGFCRTIDKKEYSTAVIAMASNLFYHYKGREKSGSFNQICSKKQPGVPEAQKKNALEGKTRDSVYTNFAVNAVNDVNDVNMQSDKSNYLNEKVTSYRRPAYFNSNNKFNDQLNLRSYVTSFDSGFD
jgi:hypothetical protein